MTSAKRRAKLKRTSTKHVRSSHTGRHDRSLVKHHMVVHNAPEVIRSEKKRVKVDNNRAISRDIIFLRKSPPRQEQQQQEKKDIVETLDINVI